MRNIHIYVEETVNGWRFDVSDSEVNGGLFKKLNVAQYYEALLGLQSWLNQEQTLLKRRFEIL
jgi:hypothetical protein